MINTSPLAKTYTLNEFWQLELDDRLKVELIAGVLFMTPPPDYIHDKVVSTLLQVLTKHISEIDDTGTIYVPRAAIWTNQNTYLEPDLFYISSELEAKLSPNQRTSADLVVEVISPGSSIYDRNTKADTYGLLGVSELWLIDQNNKTFEIRLQEGNGFGIGKIFSKNDYIASTIFPKLNLLVDSLFSKLP
ncbi:MAG: Uma2 family endonuclease [Blastocatellia bacterium]|nr:Uma2 family endonuclease [Blastocatellia bacterium]